MKNNILFTAPWCNTCTTVKSYMEDNDIQNVDIINVDLDPKKATEYGIRGLPTMIQDDDRFVGAEAIIQEFKNQGS